MPTVTVYPSATLTGPWQLASPTLHGAATLHEATADASNATYADFQPVTNNVFEVIEFDLSAIPTAATLQTAQITYAHNRRGHGTIEIQLAGITSDDAYSPGPAEAPDWTPWDVWRTRTDPVHDRTADGTLLSSLTRLGAVLKQRSPAGSPPRHHHVSQLSAEITYTSSPPTATVTAPTGVTTGTDVEWTHSQAENASAHQIKVFAEMFVNSGFDPETNTFHSYDSGKVDGSDLAGVVPGMLPGDWRAYVKVWATQPGGGELESVWVQSAFTVPNFPPLDPPGSVVAKYESDSASVAVEVWGDGYDPAHAEALEILADPGTYWLDAADAKEGDTVGVPRNPGPAKIDGPERYMRVPEVDAGNGNSYCRIFGGKPFSYVVDAGSSVEAEFTIPEGAETNEGSSLVIIGNGGSTNASTLQRMNLYLDDHVGGSFYLGLSVGGVNTYPRSDTWTGHAVAGDRVVARATLVDDYNGDEWRVHFEMSVNGGPWINLGYRSFHTAVAEAMPYTVEITRDGSQYVGRLPGSKFYSVSVNGAEIWNPNKYANPGPANVGAGVFGLVSGPPDGPATWQLIGGVEIRGGASGLAMLGGAAVLEHDGEDYVQQIGGPYDPVNGGTKGSQLTTVAAVGMLETTKFRYYLDIELPPEPEENPSGTLRCRPINGRLLFDLNCSLTAGWITAGPWVRAIWWPDPVDYRYSSGLYIKAVSGHSWGDRVQIRLEVDTTTGTTTLSARDPEPDLLGGDWDAASSQSTTANYGNGPEFAPRVAYSAGVRINGNGVNDYYATHKLYRAVTEDVDNANLEIDLWAARDLPGYSGQGYIYAGDGNAYAIGQPDEGRKLSLVTAPTFQLMTPLTPYHGEGMQLPAALTPAKDQSTGPGWTIILGQLFYYSDGPGYPRVWSVEPFGNGGWNAHLNTGNEALYLWDNAAVNAGPVPLPVAKPDSFGFRLGDGLGSVDTALHGFVDDSAMSGLAETELTPIRIGAYPVGSGVSEMRFGSVVVVNRRLTDAEIPKVLAAMQAMAIAPLQNAEICVQRSDANGTELVGSSAAWPIQPVVIRDHNADYNEPATYIAKLRSPLLSDSPWVQAESVTPITDRFWFLDPDGALPPWAPDVDRGSFQPTEARSSIVARQPGASAAAVSTELGDTIPIRVRTLNKADRERLDAYLSLGKWRLVDVHGHSWMVALTSDVSRDPIVAQPTAADTAPIRDFYMTSFTMIEVKA